VTIINVEIRDILIPKELQDAMSKEAQAERERNARVILAEIEQDISEMFAGAAHVYSHDELALQLRTMSLVYESVKASNGGVVVLPSAFGDSFNTPGNAGSASAGNTSTGGELGGGESASAAAGGITGGVTSGVVGGDRSLAADLIKKLVS
jgi:hypothetical protein